MSSFTTYNDLRDKIMKFKRIKSKYGTQLESLPASQYDIYRRYTTTARDHAPQLRASRNIRKHYPIVGTVTSDIPSKRDGMELRKDKEIGEGKIYRYTAIAPDYYSIHGKPCSKEALNAILGFEIERADRFFSLDLAKIEYIKISPTRDMVQIRPTLGNVDSSQVNDTLIATLFPRFSTSKTLENCNTLAVKKLQELLQPMMDYKGIENIIHIARNQIAPERRWYPLLQTVSPYITEVLHAIASPYFVVQTMWTEDSNVASFERLCQELVSFSLNYPDPKTKLQSLLSEITVNGQSLSLALQNLGGTRPFANICRVALSIPINQDFIIRQTSFTVISSNASPVNERLQVSLFYLDYHWKWYQGEEIIYFKSGGSRGILYKKDRSITSVQLTTVEKDIYPLMLDICVYCKTLKTGYDKILPIESSNKNHVRKIIEYHESDREEVWMSYRPQPDYENKGFVGARGEIPSTCGYSATAIAPLVVNAQPFHKMMVSGSHRLTRELKVEEVVSKAIVIDPETVPIQRYSIPFPAGVDLTHSNAYTMIRDPVSAFKAATRDLMLDKSKLKKLIDEPDDAAPELVAALTNHLASKPHVKAWYRDRLREMSGCPLDKPSDRFKVISCLIGYHSRLRYDRDTNTLIMKGGEAITYSFKSGVFTENNDSVRIYNEEIPNKKVYKNYKKITISSKAPELPTFAGLDEGCSSGLNQFYLFVNGMYETYQRRKREHEPEADIREGLKHQKLLSMIGGKNV